MVWLLQEGNVTIMAMPNDLIFVRHGQSEANIVQKHNYDAVDEVTVRALFERPDWRRYACPDTPGESPDGGEWVELPSRRRYSGTELLEQVEQSSNLL